MKIEMLGQSTPPQPKITAMLTILSPKPEVTPERVMNSVTATGIAVSVRFCLETSKRGETIRYF